MGAVCVCPACGNHHAGYFIDRKPELDRLRAEKAELLIALEDLLNLKQGCHERAEAILARANETEGK